MFSLGNGNQIKVSIILCYFYVSSFQAFYVAQFIVACLAMQKRFDELSISLKFSFSVSKIKISTSKNHEFLKFGKLFHNLCDGIEILNQTFTFHFVAILMNIVVSFNVKKQYFEFKVLIFF